MAPARFHAPAPARRRRARRDGLISLVTAPLEDLARQLGWVAERAAAGATPDGYVLGAHLEGPFLAHARCGAIALVETPTSSCSTPACRCCA